MSSSTLHPVIREHRHWLAFEEEEAKTHKLLEKAQKHTSKRDAAHRAWLDATEAFENEATDAALEGRALNPAIPDPGEWVEPRPLLGSRKKPVEVVHQRLGELEQARRSWAKRMAPELGAALRVQDAAALERLRIRVAAVAEAVEELETIRDSLSWIRARGGEAPAPLGLWEIQSLIHPLSEAVRRTQSAIGSPDVNEFGGLPFDLDNVDIG